MCLVKDLSAAITTAKVKEYKNIKCAIGSIVERVHCGTIRNCIEQRCLAVSRMAARASIICHLMVELLLLGNEEIEWPDFTKLNFFTQLFTAGVNLRKLSKPTPALEETWAKYETDFRQCTEKLIKR